MTTVTMADSASVKNIVIIGGSYSGVSCAHYLLKHVVPQLPDPKSYAVVLVSAAHQVFCRPACPRALLSDDLLPQHKLFVDIPPLFTQYAAFSSETTPGAHSFQFIHGAATALSTTARTVTIAATPSSTNPPPPSPLPYAALILATGATTPSPLLSLSPATAPLRTAWAAFRAALPAATSILVAGGGPAGVEVAAELAEHLHGRPGWFSSPPSPPRVSITLVTAGPRLLPALRPALAARAAALLERLGVAVVTDTRVEAVEPPDAGTGDAVAAPAAVTLADGRVLKVDLYVPATGMAANAGFVEAALKGADGRVVVDDGLRVKGAGPRVYALGDVASAARPAVHAVLEQVPVVCGNLGRELRAAAGVGEAALGKERTFKEDTRETQLVPLGRAWGVGAAMGWALPSWLVWAIKGRDYWLWTTGGLWSGKQWAKAS